MAKEFRLLLAFLSSTVSHRVDHCKDLLPMSDDCWKELLTMAVRQGVSGLVYSAIERLPRELMPPKEILLHMFGQVEYQKLRYEKQFETAQKFAAALKAKGVEMKILKGVSFSTYYDQPELRECGDCDSYLTAVKKASQVIESNESAGSSGFDIGNDTIVEIGGKREFGSYKHSHLYLNHLMFENHHYITDFNGTKKGKKIELLLEKAIDSTPGTPIANSDMVRPCDYFNALLLIRHAQGNFIQEGMNLRMIYDWAVLIRAEQNNLDWIQLYADFEACGLRTFVDVMTSVCVDYLGTELTCKDITLCTNKKLVNEVLFDTLANNIHLEQNEGFCHKIIRILARYKRFWHYRELAIESIPMMIWNSFAYSSYMHRDITLKKV